MKNAPSLVLTKMTISHDLLRLKLFESLDADPPALTRRDIRLPAVPGKAFATEPAVAGRTHVGSRFALAPG